MLRRGRWCWALVLVAGVGCDDDAGVIVDGGHADASHFDAFVNADAPSPFDVPRDVGAPVLLDGPIDVADASADIADASADALVSPDARERVSADPKATRRLVPGDAELVGEEFTACSNAVPQVGDQWCAFHRPGSVTGTRELWAFNLTRALAGAAPVCDGSSADCVQLTANLWTGQESFSGPSHPNSHRFDGDTLIYYAGSTSPRAIYEGPVWAWRPGWKKSRQLTSDKGVTCYGQRRSFAMRCFDDATTVEDPIGIFDKERVSALDLRAGFVGPGEDVGPLPKLERVVTLNTDGGSAWSVGFSPLGDYLLVSSVATAGTTETLRIIKTADVGKIPATTVPGVGPYWAVANDMKKFYFIAGLERVRADSDTGTLRAADFPSGASPVDLVTQIAGFQLVGNRGHVFSDVDKGLVLAQRFPDTKGFSFSVMRSRERPADLVTLTGKLSGVSASTTGAHTYFLRDEGGPWPLSRVVHNDGKSECLLNKDKRAETYSARFSDDGAFVYWIEFGGRSEQGRFARSDDCSQNTKFGDWVLWYTPLGDSYVLFEGSDDEDRDTYLQYAAVKETALEGNLEPRVIWQNQVGAVAPVKTPSGHAVVFSVTRGKPEELGIYVHVLPAQ